MIYHFKKTDMDNKQIEKEAAVVWSFIGLITCFVLILITK